MRPFFKLPPWCFVVLAFVLPAVGVVLTWAEDDANKVKWERIVGIFAPNTLAPLATLARRAVSHAARRIVLSFGELLIRVVP